MANNFDSNFTNKLMRVFLEKFETSRVLTRNIDTQLLDGKFDSSTGDTVFFKRPTDYTSFRNPTGDLTASTADDITTGKAAGVVQPYFTVHVDFDEADQALKMDQLDELLAPMATRIVTDLELDFGAFMLKNAGLIAGTFGTAVTTWSDVAEASAVMKSHGIPSDMMWTYAVNPFTQTTLSDVQRSLGAGGVAGDLVSTAHKKATISSDFAGMEVMSSTALSSFTTAAATRAGTVDSNPDVTYVTAKDTMTQTIVVTGLTNTQVYKAGEIMQIPAVNRLNLSTRKVILDAAGGSLPWTGTLVNDVTVSGTEGTFTVTGPAIFDNVAGATAHNTVDAAIVANNAVTFLGADVTTYQPNLFWHKQAFSLGSVPIKKLFSTDTLGTTEDGLQFRVSKGSDFITNSQQIRIDFRPAYSVLNPFFAGQGWG